MHLLSVNKNAKYLYCDWPIQTAVLMRYCIGAVLRLTCAVGHLHILVNIRIVIFHCQVMKTHSDTAILEN